MNARTPAEPPLIVGYQFVDALGSGGFADVFLYEQESPRRKVAVKVLQSDDFTPAARTLFRDEANLMAQLSSHPSIVTIYQSAETDDRRPFIVMEYCGRPNLGARFRTERIGVAEALAIGIQVSGAVETAHRAGVLHRDIKPANILVTEYNRPALADFGIASTLAQGAAGRVEGVSVPWSPPESFAPVPWAGPTSDVYSLGATVYSLLAGRSPFEQSGAVNGVSELQARIIEGALAPTGRPDVPASLEAVFATAMAVSPQARYTSALSFARALQRVQQELGIPVTAVDVIDDTFNRTGAIDTDQGRTRINAIGVASQAATPPTAPLSTAPLSPVPQHSAATQTAPTEVFRPPGSPTSTPGPAFTPASASIDETLRRAPTVVEAPTFLKAPSVKRSRVPGVILDIVLVLGVAGGAAYLLLTK